MKQFTTGRIVGIAIFLLSGAWVRETAMTGSTAQPAFQELSMTMVASNWKREDNGQYTCSLAGLSRTFQTANGFVAQRVFLTTDSKEILISNEPVVYMSGIVWSDIEGDCLKMYYMPFGHQTALPFSSISLRVTI